MQESKMTAVRSNIASGAASPGQQINMNNLKVMAAPICKQFDTIDVLKYLHELMVMIEGAPQQKVSPKQSMFGVG